MFEVVAGAYHLGAAPRWRGDVSLATSAAVRSHLVRALEAELVGA